MHSKMRNLLERLDHRQYCLGYFPCLVRSSLSPKKSFEKHISMQMTDEFAVFQNSLNRLVIILIRESVKLRTHLSWEKEILADHLTCDDAPLTLPTDRQGNVEADCTKERVQPILNMVQHYRSMGLTT
jgi:hypothetical protein